MQVMSPASLLESCSCAMMKSAPCLPIKIATCIAIDNAGFWHGRSDRYSSALVHPHEFSCSFIYFFPFALSWRNNTADMRMGSRPRKRLRQQVALTTFAAAVTKSETGNGNKFILIIFHSYPYILIAALNGLNTSSLVNNLHEIRAILFASATAVL